MTLPSGGWLQSFSLEIVLSFILMFVIMGVATDHRAQGVMAGVAIGGTVCFEALLGGVISGASMNPARSFGPALVQGNFSYQWIYWVAPILGSLIGVWSYKTIQCQKLEISKSGCC
jgi:aquaporin Z